jgi:NADH-quinone oxidoreductase subunit L
MSEMFNYIWVIPALPLIGALINIFFNRNHKVSGMIGCATVGMAFFLVLIAFFQLISLPDSERSINVVVYSWITSGTFNVDVAFLIDPLSMIMMLVVTGVGFLIHIYSIGYMGKDPCCIRYFTYLNLFMFSMLLLVMGNNFLLMFVGWEGVGLCSYLLIGFWCERESAANAGMKAFVVNRIGDFAFIIGMIFIFVYTGSLTYNEVFSTDPEILAPVITAITLLLFIGAIGKSAQVPLHIWLPDAMEGPTPVSALIHAATMVTAGVYMIARCHTLFMMSPTVMTIIAVIGAITAIFAASIGLTQYDIKRVLAYSTISQLGFMFLACGVGFFSAGVFHLVTHAFFKALLFMGAGSVIHAMEHAVGDGKDPQDLRNMGGLKAKMPTTYKTMLIAALAISGIFPFAGFFSKDLILWGAFANFPALWGLAVIAAFMTSFYMFRLIYLTFYGTSRLTSDESIKIHESPPSMTIPLIILAVLSTIGGLIGVPHILIHGLDQFGQFLSPVFITVPELAMDHMAILEFGTMALSLVISLAGIILAYVIYVNRKVVPGHIKPIGIHRILLHRYCIDEIYGAIVVKPIEKMAWGLWRIVDNVIIDGIITLGAVTIRGLGSLLRYSQTGIVQNYALMMVIGAVFVIGYLTGFLGP